MFLQRLHAHPRDACIRFIEEGHLYYVNWSGNPDDDSWEDNGMNMSVTGLVQLFFEHFKADEVLAKSVENGTWKEKYGNQTVEEVKAGWKEVGVIASRKGTNMHNTLEKYINVYAETGNVYTAMKAVVTDIRRYEIETEFVYFLGFIKKECLHLIPYRTEWRFWTDRTIRLTGSADMLFVDTIRTTQDCLALHLMDWKRSKDVNPLAYNFKRYGLGPLSHVKDTKYYHYVLQLSLYRRMFELYYRGPFIFNGHTYPIARIVQQSIVVFHPTKNSARLLPTLYLHGEVSAMLEWRRLDVLERERMRESGLEGWDNVFVAAYPVHLPPIVVEPPVLE